MNKLWFDLETYSPVPITHGAHAYAEQAEILLWAYAIDDEKVKCWDVTSTHHIPDDLFKALASDCEVWGHNSGMFDHIIVEHCMKPLQPAVSRWRDTMVQAFCHSLPGKLETLGEVFKLDADQAKDKRGKQLIQRFCKPKKDGGRDTRETHSLEWAEFIEYAKSDITAMRFLHKKMPKWNYPNNKFELSLWHLDQEINRRGVCMDVDLAGFAIAEVTKAQANLAEKTVEQTNGEVESATQRDKMLQHILKAHGVALPNMQKATLERRIADPDLPDAVRELLELRLQSSTSSTAKYKRVIESVSSDGRLRGLLQFSGASRTQRWSGRTFQPQNLPRPDIDDDAITLGIAAIKIACADLITDNVPKLAANCLRALIVAPKGKKLVVADLSNIEGRAAAYLAGEHWKVQAFKDFDAGTGPDLYVSSYAKAFKVPVESVTKDQRQIGKVMELAFAYSAGINGFNTFATAYNINLDELAEKTLNTLPPDILAEAEGFYAWSMEAKRSTLGLSKDAFLVCEGLKRVWRRAHPAISGMWPALENAARKALALPAVYFNVGEHVGFTKDGGWLKMHLPSGDFLSYPAPKIVDDAITYMGMSQYTRKWERVNTYGGKLFENLCQKFARNIMAHNMPEIENNGYQIALTVHDELITETPDEVSFSAENLSVLLAKPPEWAENIPLAAAGFESYFYKK